MRKEDNISKLLNLKITNLINNTSSEGKLMFPKIQCPYVWLPDYLALFDEKRKFNFTEKTAICFYMYDNKFDGINGLFNSIYYNDTKRLEQFKEKLKDCKMFIMPDYSLCRDIYPIENEYRRFKALVVSLWLTMNLNTLVIPNITYSNEESFEHMLDGFRDSEVIAFSSKGSCREKEAKQIFLEALKYVVDNMPNLKAIVVYSTSKKETTLSMFKYAIDKGIEICIPNNTLLDRNKEKSNGKNW